MEQHLSSLAKALGIRIIVQNFTRRRELRFYDVVAAFFVNDVLAVIT
jgi:hypothetical protein